MMKITATQLLVGAVIKAEIIADKEAQTATIEDVVAEMTNDTK
jgi:hypothetical protein